MGVFWLFLIFGNLFLCLFQQLCGLFLFLLCQFVVVGLQWGFFFFGELQQVDVYCEQGGVYGFVQQGSVCIDIVDDFGVNFGNGVFGFGQCLYILCCYFQWCGVGSFISGGQSIGVGLLFFV